MTEAVVDTHALIWHLEENKRLGPAARDILLSGESRLIIPVIVLCELYYYLKKRGSAGRYPVIYQRIRSDSRVTIDVLEPDMILLIPPDLEMHDGIIVACALKRQGVVLLSKDTKIKKWFADIVWD